MAASYKVREKVLQVRFLLITVVVVVEVVAVIVVDISKT